MGNYAQAAWANSHADWGYAFFGYNNSKICCGAISGNQKNGNLTPGVQM